MSSKKQIKKITIECDHIYVTGQISSMFVTALNSYRHTVESICVKCRATVRESVLSELPMSPYFESQLPF